MSRRAKRDLISHFKPRPRRQSFADQDIGHRVIRPRSLHLPPGMGDAHASGEIVRTEAQGLKEIGSKYGDFVKLARELRLYRQHGRETNNIVPPEGSFDLG